MRSAVPIVILVGALLAGCSMALDESSPVYSAEPGKYDLASCEDINKNIRSRELRESELTALMARAGEGGGGAMVNALVYRDQLSMARANLVTLRKAADEKRCPPDIKPQTVGISPVH